jgi:hypothetical protein
LRGIIVKKRGQITPFIILGIVILISTGIIFYMRSLVAEESLKAELIPEITQIPAEVRPVRAFVEECLSSVSEEALRKVGDGGGYIDTAEAGLVTSSFDPTEADGIQFAPDSTLRIQYWAHLSSPNNCEGDCTFASERPPFYGHKVQIQ